MMKALTYHPHEKQWVLRQLPIPTTGEFDVLVRVFACGLNPVDAKIALWKSMASEMSEHWVAGLDVAGEIVHVGSAVKHWRTGDRILTHGNMFRPHGGFAEYSIQDARTLIPHPSVASELAAATPCAGWTAWRALHDKLRITVNDTILIAGGSGGVGGFAVQIARMAGLRTVIATTSSANAGYVKDLGATHVIDYRNDDVVAAVKSLTAGRGVTRGLDCVGGINAKIVADCLGFEGEMVELVNTVEPKEYANSFMYGLSFHQLSLGSGHRNGDAGRLTLTRTGAAFSEALERGNLHVRQLQVIGLDDAGSALENLLNQRTTGKIVVRMAIEEREPDPMV